MKKKIIYRNNNKKFYTPYNKRYNKFGYNKNVYKDGRKEETRLIIDQSFEDNAPYLKYDLQELLYDDKFIEKANKYQECRILRVACQISALKEQGIVKAYYNDLLNEQVKYVVFPKLKSVDLRWYKIRNNTFDYIDVYRFGHLCFINKNQLKLKGQIRVVVIFRNERTELKDVNWKIINNKSIENSNTKDISDNIKDISSIRNTSSEQSIRQTSSELTSDSDITSFIKKYNTSKAGTTFVPSGKNMVLKNDEINDFSKLMVNRLVRSYEEFLDSYYLKRRKAKNLYDKEKKRFNKLAGMLKDVNKKMENDIKLYNSGLIDNKVKLEVEERFKNMTGTIALVNSKIKQYDEKLSEYNLTDSNLKSVKITLCNVVRDMMNIQKCLKQIAKECRDNSNKISILQSSSELDDVDPEIDFLGYNQSIKKKNYSELFDTYEQAELYMNDKYKKAKERKLHKIVYDELLHKYKIV